MESEMKTSMIRMLKPGFVTLLLIAVTLAGCSRQPAYKLVPAKGVVKIKGKPAANIMINSMPDIMAGNNGPTSNAVTNINGEFELKTNDQKSGAVAGRHIITLFDMDEERPEQGTQATKPPRIDSKYSTAAGGVPYEIKADSLIEINIE
jgi:hypothetical protein